MIDMIKDLALLTLQFYITLALALSAWGAYMYFYVLG